MYTDPHAVIHHTKVGSRARSRVARSAMVGENWAYGGEKVTYSRHRRHGEQLAAIQYSAPGTKIQI